MENNFIIFAEIGEQTTKIPVLKVGSWVYGGKKLAITKDIIQKMYDNYKAGIRPKPPTKLVIDYNHASQSASPENAKAAGWIEGLELEENTLYMKPKWTAAAKKMIADEEYKYISPEFTLNYTNKETGEDVGAALLSVAITNRPFLEGFEGLSLTEEVIDMSDEDAKKAQEARSKKYGISIREDGNVTKPSEYADVADGDFADPVNYAYPLTPEERAIAAYKYFSKPKNKGFYSPEEQKKIESRIIAKLPENMKEEARKNFKMEEIMDEKEMEGLKIALTETNAKLTEANEKIDALQKQADTLKKAYEDAQTALAHEKSVAWVEIKLREHKLFPTEAEFVTKMYESNPDETIKWIEARGKVVPDDIKTSGTDKPPDELTAIQAIINEKKCTWAEANVIYNEQIARGGK